MGDWVQEVREVLLSAYLALNILLILWALAKKIYDKYFLRKKTENEGPRYQLLRRGDAETAMEETVNQTVVDMETTFIAPTLE